MLVHDYNSDACVDEGDVISLHGIGCIAHLSKAIHGNVVDVLGTCCPLADDSIADGARNGLQLTLPLAFEFVQFIQHVRF